MVACAPKVAHCERGGFAGPMTSVSAVLPLSLSGTSTIVGRSGERTIVGGGDVAGLAGPNLAMCLTMYCFFVVTGALFREVFSDCFICSPFRLVFIF